MVAAGATGNPVIVSTDLMWRCTIVVIVHAEVLGFGQTPSPQRVVVADDAGVLTSEEAQGPVIAVNDLLWDQSLVGVTAAETSVVV